MKEETPAVNGQDIMVSLDIKLQDTVEQALAEGVKDLETEEGSSIVMDGATGEIYAACSLPYMNPADMSSSQVGSESVKAITQAYEPGSTFKSVSALTILEQGTMGPEDTMFCPSSISADDYDVSDSHERDGETYSLREIAALCQGAVAFRMGLEPLHARTDSDSDRLRRQPSVATIRSQRDLLSLYSGAGPPMPRSRGLSLDARGFASTLWDTSGSLPAAGQSRCSSAASASQRAGSGGR